MLSYPRRIVDLGRGLKAVYIYFNNDAEAFAARNALTLAQQLRATVGH